VAREKSPIASMAGVAGMAFSLHSPLTGESTLWKGLSLPLLEAGEWVFAGHAWPLIRPRGK
jgi:hypothetical protein